jgi:methionyl-tRNA formyltransferase
MRQRTVAEPDLVDAVKAIVADLPGGTDLLLPGSVTSLAGLLGVYQPDVLLVFGFNWRLPRDVLEIPTLGTLNVHPSALPKHRGPSPVLWAIRNGDPYLGLTVHRMTERIDAGPILAQVDDLPIPDQVTREDIWQLQQAALPELLEVALDRLLRGDSGTPQAEEQATYAGFPPPDWYTVTWQGSRFSLHNQIRVLRYLKRGAGPVAELQGRTVQVRDTSLTDNGGVRLDCADGPLWVTAGPVTLVEACLDRCPQGGCPGIGEWLEQGEGCGQLLAAGLGLAESLLAVGQVKRCLGFLPLVAELSVHAGGFAVEVGCVLDVATGEQDFASAVQGGRFAAMVPDLTLQ